MGYHHIAKAEVTATLESDGSYTLPLHGTLHNQMSIAYMDLTDITRPTGNAIIGTNYSLEYSNGGYNLVISNENKVINITLPNQSSSFIVLFPNADKDVDIISDKFKKYTFKDGIAASNLYYKYISDVEHGTLRWEEMEGYGEINGHFYVDLGLPSGLKWAICNVGANYAENYGNYYAWGEIEPKTSYTEDNCHTYATNILEISGDAQRDAATAYWGESWRMPNENEMQELVGECERINT